MYYSNRPVFGNFSKRRSDGTPAYIFAVLIGGRGIGKTYSTQNLILRRFFKHGEKFLWLRLKEPAVKKLLANDAKDFIDSRLLEKWKITDVKVKNDDVYINGREAGKIMALSTFYQTKGVSLNKAKVVIKKRTESETQKMLKETAGVYKNIILDEMNQEKNEKRTMDIAYSFVNQLETVCRLDTERRIILMGNTLDEASDILASSFDFIPDKFGLYKLHNKRAIIHYVPDGKEFSKARALSIAGILAPTESTFTNKTKSDTELINTKSPGKPTLIIRFSNTCYFTLHESGIITQQKTSGTPGIRTVAMVPYLAGHPYYKEQRDLIIQMTQTRSYKFDKLKTLKLFIKEIKLLKNY